MKDMNNHVVNLELCKKLKEAGYPQESEFYWYYLAKPSAKNESEEWNLYRGVETLKKDYAAPLATELFERLPEHIEAKKSLNSYWVILDHEKPENARRGVATNIEKGKSLPNALAECYLWLVENDYL